MLTDRAYYLTLELISCMKFQQIIEGLILALLTLVVYLFTINPLTKAYSVYALILCLVFFGVLYLISLYKGDDHNWRLHGKLLKILLFTFITAILLWVGNTGWFLSPFFYLLYIVAISVAFLFSTSVTFSFVLVLIAILLPNLSDIQSRFDLVTVFSLLLIIPLSYFLSHVYLQLKEKEKKILILEHEKKEYKSKVDELLGNRITKIGAELREPINDIKQLALYYPNLSSKKEREKYRERIVNSSEKALHLIDTFELETTGRAVLRSTKNSSKETF